MILPDLSQNDFENWLKEVVELFTGSKMAIFKNIIRLEINEYDSMEHFNSSI